jgi:hypothetical protein
MLINNVRGWARTQLIRVRTGSTPTFQDRVRDYAQTHQIGIPDHIERQLVVLDSLKLQMKGADQQLARRNPMRGSRAVPARAPSRSRRSRARSRRARAADLANVRQGRGVEVLVGCARLEVDQASEIDL